MEKFYYSKLESTFCNYGYKDFKYVVVVVVNDELHHRSSGGMLSQAFSLSGAKVELHLHDLSCRENDIFLYRCLEGNDFLS